MYLLCAIDLFSKYACVVERRDKKRTSIVNAFKKIISKENQIKYGLIKVVNFIIIPLKIFWKQITLRCIQHTMKENLLLWDLLEHWKTRFLNIWQLFKKMFILVIILLINTIAQFIKQ